MVSSWRIFSLLSRWSLNKFILYSIAVYKALYKSFGGFAADVVAAIDQVKRPHSEVNV